MSNADDRCARDGCGHKIVAHGASFAHRGTGACLAGLCQCKSPVEPAPQAAPSAPSHEFIQYRDPDARGCLHQDVPSGPFCGRPSQAHEPAPSGDEAKVRELIATWTMSTKPPRPEGHRMKEDAIDKMIELGIEGAVKAAYAAGKADGARENERDMVEYLLGLAGDGEGRVTDALKSGRWREELDIARRGSEGK